jgi:glucose-6-phosphate isomerase
VRHDQGFRATPGLRCIVRALLKTTQFIAFDPTTGVVGHAPRVTRHLEDLRGCFRDAAAFERLRADGNPLVYSVSAVELGTAEGDLHCGLGVIQPGRVGDEYFLTKGHLHAWREAAEVYIGLAGQGLMLLEDQVTGESRAIPLQPNALVYVPGHTAHRTVNTGDAPLAYLGIYPARAGHDYSAIARQNFRHVVVERDGEPCMLPRSEA